MSTRPEIRRDYEAKDRDEVMAIFTADRETLKAEGYVAVEERWSEPDRELPGLGAHAWRYVTNRVRPEHPELVKLSQNAPTERFHHLEVRYAPIEDAPKSKGGLLDITVTNNGRCPHCDRPTMQMPRPPFERYCNECEAEFPE